MKYLGLHLYCMKELLFHNKSWSGACWTQINQQSFYISDDLYSTFHQMLMAISYTPKMTPQQCQPVFQWCTLKTHSVFLRIKPRSAADWWCVNLNRVHKAISLGNLILNLYVAELSSLGKILCKHSKYWTWDSICSIPFQFLRSVVPISWVRQQL